jgi:putative SOS response-associated peptidase YedK
MAYRLITALRIQLEPPPGVSSQEIIANLDGDGCNLLKSGVRPRAPKARIVDLRPGDYVLLNGMWRKVIGLVMHSEQILTDEQAAEHKGRGWLVKAKESYVSPIIGHHRMPVLLTSEAEYATWLNPEVVERGSLEAMLRPIGVEGWGVIRQGPKPATV